jgi:hypothetical protein
MGLIVGFAVLVLAALVFGMLLGHGRAIFRALAGAAVLPGSARLNDGGAAVLPFRRPSTPVARARTAAPCASLRLAA